MKLFEVVLSLLSVITLSLCMQPEAPVEQTSEQRVRHLLQYPSKMKGIPFSELQECVQLIEEELVRTTIVPGFKAWRFIEYALEALSKAKNAEGNAPEHYAIRFLRSCAPILYGGIYVHDDEIKDLNAHAHEHYLECLERELDRISIMENTQVYKEARVAQEEAKSTDSAIHTISFRNKVEAAQLAYYDYFGESEELYRQLVACVYVGPGNYSIRSTTLAHTMAIEQFRNATSEQERLQAAEKLHAETETLRIYKDRHIDSAFFYCLDASDAEIDLLSQTQLKTFFETVKKEASNAATATPIIAAFEAAIQQLKFDEARAHTKKLMKLVKDSELPKPKSRPSSFSTLEILEDPSAVEKKSVPERQEWLERMRQGLITTLIVPGYKHTELTEVALKALAEAEADPRTELVIKLLSACSLIFDGGVHASNKILESLSSESLALYFKVLESELERISICENTNLYEQARSIHDSYSADKICVFRDSVRLARNEYENYFRDSETLVKQLATVCSTAAIEPHNECLRKFKEAKTDNDRKASIERLDSENLRNSLTFHQNSCLGDRLNADDNQIKLLDLEKLSKFFDNIKKEALQAGVDELRVSGMEEAFKTAIRSFKFDDARCEIRKLIQMTNSLPPDSSKPSISSTASVVNKLKGFIAPGIFIALSGVALYFYSIHHSEDVVKRSENAESDTKSDPNNSSETDVGKSDSHKSRHTIKDGSGSLSLSVTAGLLLVVPLFV